MIQRTTLDWARDIARSYRNALRAIAPDKCAELDARARDRGQTWIAPTPAPVDSEALDESLDRKLTAPQIEALWGVKAATIRSWARVSRRDPTDPTKPLLQQHPGEHGPLYIPREVLAVQARHRRPKTA